MHSTIIKAKELNQILGSDNLIIIDCRFYLSDIGLGQKEYIRSHIPNAYYAHLNNDLSGKIIKGKTGRHPFPDVDIFTKKLGEWGIDKNAQVVVYDQSHGGIAARLWFLLKWLGHEKAAVLEGGWKRWTEQGFPVSKDISHNSKKIFLPSPKPHMLATLEEVENISKGGEFLLVDSRTAERYRGENEPIDPVAGHIPGAVSAPFLENLDEGFCFLEKEKLEKRFDKILENQPLEKTVFYCGSGVTACHNILALHHIGKKGARLFPGSWSEWIVDPRRKVEIG